MKEVGMEMPPPSAIKVSVARCQGSIPKALGVSGARWGSQQTDSREAAAEAAGSILRLLGPARPAAL